MRAAETAAAGLVVVALLASCTAAATPDSSVAVTAERPPATPTIAPEPAPPATVSSSLAPVEAEPPVSARSSAMCFGEGVEARDDDEERVAALLDGTLLIGDHAPHRLPVDPHWLENDFEDASWAFGYQSLIWVDALRRNDPDWDSAEARQLYGFLLEDWWTDNGATPEPTTSKTVGTDYRWFDMAVARRALVLLCALPELGESEWLLEAIETHGEVLASKLAYAGTGNHALHQNTALAAVGHVIENPAWVQTAADRTAALLEQAIDEQGLSLEGSASYQLKNYIWWSDARERFDRVGAELGASWERLELMPDAMAHLVAPDGRWIMVGDTLPAAIGGIGGTPFDYARTSGADGSQPPETSVALDAGYVVMRNQWAPTDDGAVVNVLSLRHGPPMTTQVHGHEDLGSITFYSDDLRLIEDGGIYGYFAGETRRYMLDNSSHNVVTIEGAEYYRTAQGELTFFTEGEGWAAANVSIGALSGARWNRTVIALVDAGIVIVDDRISQNLEREVDQRWHLASGSTVSVEASTATIEIGDEPELSLIFLGQEPEIELATGMRSSTYRVVEEVPQVRSVDAGPARFSTVIATGEATAALISRSSTGLHVVVERDGGRWDISLGDGVSGEGLEIRSFGTP